MTPQFVVQSLEITDKNEDLVVVYFSPEDDGDCHFSDRPTQSTILKSNEFGMHDEMSDVDITVDEEAIRDSANHMQAMCEEMDQGDSEKEEELVFNNRFALETASTWKAAEANRSLGYTGLSDRTKRRRRAEAIKGAEERERAKTSDNPQVHFMRSFFQKKPVESRHGVNQGSDSSCTITDLSNIDQIISFESDESGSESESGASLESTTSKNPGPVLLPRVPSLQRMKHEIPVRQQRAQVKEEKAKANKEALDNLQALIRSKKTTFQAGNTGLQLHRVRAIESHLKMVVNRGRSFMEASSIAAESQGFSPSHGARLLRGWVRNWVNHRSLPQSNRGTHTKIASLLDDPAIKAELRMFVRKNKWSMNPEKMRDFAAEKARMVSDEDIEQRSQKMEKEVAGGLKQYIETDLCPRLRIRLQKPISINTARRWLQSEGFRYTTFKKGLYFDGHDRPDVVNYRQESFLPEMEKYSERLVRYSPENPKIQLPLPNPDVRPLVLVAHDEMTAQANDSASKSWVLEDQHQLRKKGVGRGLHQSDVICSTVGWLKDASQTLEYGKLYEGYWTGELFVKQMREKIIPAFERAHPANYQALFLIDNSQGHGTHAEDALLASRMNVRPGGKQAKMRNGWFVKDGERVQQPMVFPVDHPSYPGEAKGIKVVLAERGLLYPNLKGACTPSCPKDETETCCGRRLLSSQPDFLAQKSLIEEVVTELGHLCIKLPKYHCELNFIEYFWGAVKRHLRENCEYTFMGLKDNMGIALTSVSIETIRRWENRVHRWMDAYRSGLETIEAQAKVKAFSSKRYTSHRRIPESVAQMMDEVQNNK